jgi:hypothetical protein
MSEGIHVRPKGDHWLVTRGNYTLEEFKTYQQAVELAQQRAKSTRADLYLHAEDGSVACVQNHQSLTGQKPRVRRSA